MAFSATALTIYGIAATTAATAVSAQQSHATAVHAGEQRRDQQFAQGQLQADAVNKQKKTELEQAQAAARARDRAIAGSTSVSAPDVATTMTGDVGTPNTKKTSLLGY